MKRIPGGVWLEPADIGFNAAVIAAAGNLNGLIIPWIAARAIRRVVIVAKETGASSVTLRMVDAFDFDGVTPLLNVGLFGIWTNITAGMFHASSGNPTVPGLTPGAVGAAASSFLFGAPYTQFNVLNNDGANAATVTIWIGLFE